MFAYLYGYSAEDVADYLSEKIVIDKMVLAKATESGFTLSEEDKAEVDEYVTNYTDSFVSTGVNPEDIRQLFYNDSIISAYLEEMKTGITEDDVKAYIDALTDKKNEKPELTESGTLVLKWLQLAPVGIYKAKDIAEGMFVSSRTVSGAMRKLVSDGYVEKVGQDPVIYSLTEKGKTVEII